FPQATRGTAPEPDRRLWISGVRDRETVRTSCGRPRELLLQEDAGDNGLRRHCRVGAEGPTALKALALVEPERCRLTNSRLQSEENQPGIARFPLNPREQSLRHSLPARP